MFFRQVYDERLAQASYLIGSSESGEALVVDPQRDIDIYLEIAREQGLRIVAVTETHIHADFLSGARELAHATGAKLYLSGENRGAEGYASGELVTFLRDGEEIKIGELRVRGLHTPGHTPEHMCFAVFAATEQDQPMLLLSGDFIFVGDLGRPDLLEEALGHAGSAKIGASQTYSSLQNILAHLPDFVAIWPGHGAGSACGRALGNVPSSTLGYERRFAWWSGYLDRGDQAGFMDELLSGQPDAPTYFAGMKQLNRGGVRLLNGLPRPLLLSADELHEQLESGSMLVDTRPREAFVQSHTRGGIHIADGPAFSNWSAWFIPTDARVVLIAQPERVEHLVRGLIHVGIDNVVGFVSVEIARGLPQVSLTQVDAHSAREDIEGARAVALDVRSTAEFEAAHIPGAVHVSAGRLLRAAQLLPRDRPLIVCCAQGERSVAAVSVLQVQGFANARNLEGGFNSWRSLGASVAG